MKSLMYITLFANILFALSCAKANREVAGYSGKNLSGEVEIVRDKQTKAATIKINKNMKWKLFAGRSDKTISFSEPIAQGKGTGETPLDVPNDVRSYFEITTPNGDAIVAERQLPMEGAYNFRDLGGLTTQDGRYVKWGKFFRADDLNNLTASDLIYLASIPLVSVVDFRAESEVSLSPDRLPHSVKEVFAYSINPGNIIDIDKIKDVSPAGAQELMRLMNEALVSDAEIVDQYKKFFAVLQNDDNIPVVFHCSAGKDRTGMAAALILSALGVDRESIIEDYLLSNSYLSDKYAPLIEQNPDLEPIYGVRAEYIGAGFEKITEIYGSVENYLIGPLGVDIEAFRKKFLD